MANRKLKNRRPPRGQTPSHSYARETRAADATTVGWTVSVIMVLVCDIGAAAAHLYTQYYPAAHGMALLRELLLFSAAVIGFFSLAMLPAVFKLRRVRAPAGFTAFAVCVAMAPILAFVLRNLR